MKNTALFYNNFDKNWIRLQNPHKIIQADHLKDVIPQLESIENYVQKGYLAAGMISYEAAGAFDSALVTQKPSDFPLVWFGIYKHSTPLDPQKFSENSFEIGVWQPSICEEKYKNDIQSIKQYIRDGYTYQTNYTYRLYSTFKGKPLAFFHTLINNQKTKYSAFIDTGLYAICSVSPELFFKLDGKDITSIPMKGTASRGRFMVEDEKAADWLYRSTKNRSENIMIVDMMRNDIGRIAQTGSVQVKSLYDIESYPTAFQMTSTVTAKTQASLTKIFGAMFPPGSVTGAPKPKTMQIISELETTPRNIYTGCMGFILPDGKAQFNVAIRTVLIDYRQKKAEYGVGGGIVWESNEYEEWKETETKALVLMEKHPDFKLLETILWNRQEGFFLLDYHINRLKASARYFGFLFREDEIKKMLEFTICPANKGSYKIRLLVDKTGAVLTESEPIANDRNKKSVQLGLSEHRVQSDNPFLFHKTTYRKIYDEALSLHPDFDDVIFLNERDEVTQTCNYNIVIKNGNNYLTPKLECGLLPGTFRESLLDRNEIKETIIHKNVLLNADEIFVINSVRKWQKAELLKYKQCVFGEHGFICF